MKTLILFVTGVVGLTAIFSAGRLLAGPVRYATLLLARVVLGYGVLFAFNAIAFRWAPHLPENPVTAALVGVLGVPGGLLVFAMQLLWQV